MFSNPVFGPRFFEVLYLTVRNRKILTKNKILNNCFFKYQNVHQIQCNIVCCLLTDTRCMLPRFIVSNQIVFKMYENSFTENNCSQAITWCADPSARLSFEPYKIGDGQQKL